jgi:2-iminobutanoate/2-iminopropanoate deaminase
MHKTITPANAPAAIGPYSPATRAGDFVFCSGQLPIDPATGEFVPGGVTEQTHQVIKNIQVLLAAAGAELKHVCKASVFLADMAYFAEMNAVYAQYFTGDFPARSTFQVARLPKDSLVEIEVIAHVGA